MNIPKEFEDAPALFMRLHPDETQVDGTPFECCDCPFAGTIPGEDYNPDDPSEGYYECELQGGLKVWGENPNCQPAQWCEKAMAELAVIRRGGEEGR